MLKPTVKIIPNKGAEGPAWSSGIYTETPSGTIDDSNVTFTVTHTITKIIHFAIGRLYIHPSDYSISGHTITFNDPLGLSLAGENFTIVYL
jgi:hypothetical protein